MSGQDRQGQAWTDRQTGSHTVHIWIDEGQMG